MLTELEFAKRRYQLYLKMMPSLVDEAVAKNQTQKEAEAEIDFLLDQINFMRKQIKKMENE